MRVELSKRADGGTILKCVRGDGTQCWQKLGGPQAAFFPLHDLTHFAVESELGVRQGFFGLVSQGWSFEDTTAKGAKGPLPPEATFVEALVGLLDAERAGSTLWNAGDFNASLARHLGANPAHTLTDADLARIRARRAELFEAWTNLPPGETLVLQFLHRAYP